MTKLSRDGRLAHLREIIEQRHTIATAELQHLAGVSRMTLYRDLETLEAEGFIERMHGSVTLARGLYDMEASLTANVEEKQRIAQHALQTVRENDIIFFGAGTTTLEVAKLVVAAEIPVTIVTNSIPIACAVKHSSNVRLILIGGDYHSDTQSLVGPIAQASLRGLTGRTLFLGANSIDLVGGITAYFAGHAELLRLMMAECKQVVAVIDSTKFGEVSVHRICRLDQVDLLITDAGLDPTFREALEAQGVPLVIA